MVLAQEHARTDKFSNSSFYIALPLICRRAWTADMRHTAERPCRLSWSRCFVNSQSVLCIACRLTNVGLLLPRSAVRLGLYDAYVFGTTYLVLRSERTMLVIEEAKLAGTRTIVNIVYLHPMHRTELAGRRWSDDRLDTPRQRGCPGSFCIY